MRYKILLFLASVLAVNCSAQISQLNKIVASDRTTGDKFGYSVSISGNYAISASYQDGDAITGQTSALWAGTAANDAIGGTVVWNTPGNAAGSNAATYAVTSSLSGGAISNYLKATNFGFSIPAGNVITGVQAQVEWKANGTEPTDNKVYLVKAGVIQTGATNKSTNTSIGITQTTKTYGGVADIWGVALTEADVEDPGFGVAFAVTKAGGGGRTVSIARINITVYYSTSPTFSNAGSAYIYEYNGSNWVQMQKIVASDRAASDYFGYSVSISGSYAIVGAYLEDEDAAGGNLLGDAGSAYIFENQAGTWVQVQKIVASDRATNDWFGISVSISGNYAIVGAYKEDEDAAGGNTLGEAGSAYIFENQAGTWVQVQKIVASDRGAADGFSRVSISGNYVVVGALGEDEDAAGGNTLGDAGSAYIFFYNGSSWVQQQKIVASNRGLGNFFGIACISGNYIIVGAYNDDYDAAGGNVLGNAGAAYLFYYNGTSWNQVQKIVASDRAISDAFGSRVSISGSYVIVGAWNEDEDAAGGNTLGEAGSAYIFENQAGTWVQVQKIVASDRAASDYFGIDVSISGSYAIVGAYTEDEDESGGNTKLSAGSAYIFTGITSPIKLLTFSGACESNAVKLQWQTASESNNDYFTIERSSPFGGGWEGIGTVKGAGNSSTIRSYDFFDPLPFGEGQGERFYRLKQTDYNGAYEHFGPISVSCDPSGEWNLILQGTPAQDELSGTFFAPEDMQVQTEIYDLQGRRISGRQWAVSKGSNLLEFGLKDIPNGLYLLKVHDEKNQLVKKFVCLL